MLPKPSEEGVTDAVKQLIKALNIDGTRDGLKKTPERIAKMYLKMFSGLYEDYPAITMFSQEESEKAEDEFDGVSFDIDQMVVVDKLPFYSMCEHHFVPFHGIASVGYLPGEKFPGLSKPGRVVKFFASRPQVQERLTDQIARFLFKKADLQGVIVRTEAEHLCMSMRGLEAPGHRTTFTKFYGEIDKNEFLQHLMIARMG